MIESVKLIQFPVFREDRGELSVFEQNSLSIPFDIKRVFNVRSPKGSIRGQHAHRLCSQLLICSNGSIEVICDDSLNKMTYLLDKPNYGLLVPPGIWAEQKYIKHNTSMTVICDRNYEESDYINNYKLYQDFVLNEKIRNKN